MWCVCILWEVDFQCLLICSAIRYAQSHIIWHHLSEVSLILPVGVGFFVLIANSLIIRRNLKRLLLEVDSRMCQFSNFYHIRSKWNFVNNLGIYRIRITSQKMKIDCFEYLFCHASTFGPKCEVINKTIFSLRNWLQEMVKRCYNHINQNLSQWPNGKVHEATIHGRCHAIKKSCNKDLRSSHHSPPN